MFYQDYAGIGPSPWITKPYGLSEYLFVMAVNPEAEAKLMGLRHAVVGGRYFVRADEHPVITHLEAPGTSRSSIAYTIPLLLTTASPESGWAALELDLLRVPEGLQQHLGSLIKHAPYIGLHGPLARLSGQVVARTAFSYAALWRAMVDTDFLHHPVRSLNGFRLRILPLQPPGNDNFVLGGSLTLTRTRSPYPERWPTAVRAVPDARMAAWSPLGEPFRRVIIGAYFENLFLSTIGVYNPGRLRVADDPLTHLPLVAYRPETGQEVLTASGHALNPPTAVLPDASPGGLWTAPPQAITSIGAAAPLLSRAPISSIRVKVSAVAGLGAGGVGRLRHVAEEITRATGLAVDIVRGSSPEQILIRPGRLHGFPKLGWVQTEWVRLGTSVEILRQVSLSQVVMLVPVLVSAALFAGIDAWIGLVGDRRRWAVALATGAAPNTIFRHLIGQASTQGLGVALLAVATAGIIGHGPALILALPTGLGAAVVVVGAMAPAALQAARQDPVAGLKPDPPARMARTAVATGAQLGLALSAAGWRRLLLAVGALISPAAVTYGVGLVQMGWHNALHITVLGQYLLVHGGWLMTAAALVTAGLTAVAAGEIARAGAVWRRGTWAVGAAVGWPGRVVVSAIAWEAGLVGLLAGLLGTGAAVIVLSPLFGVPMDRELAVGTVLGMVCVSELSAWPAVRFVRRHDPVLVLKGGPR